MISPNQICPENNATPAKKIDWNETQAKKQGWHIKHANCSKVKTQTLEETASTWDTRTLSILLSADTNYTFHQILIKHKQLCFATWTQV